MRDILIAIPLGLILAYALFKPRIGAYGWAWFSLANPHLLAYGFARSIPWGQGIAILTMAGLLFSKDRKPFPWTSITVIYVLFLVWMTITSFFAIAPASMVWDQWIFVIKIHVMIFVTLLLVRGREQIDALVWIVALSIGVYGVKAGIWVVLSGGGSRVYGPQGGLLGNNNEFAIGLIVTIPLLYYLYTVAQNKWLRWATLASLPACFLAVLGSHSRGAFLGIVVMGAFLALRSKKNLGGALMVLVAVAVLLGFGLMLMPENWTERMNTIRTYEEDSSAMSRLQIWGMIWQLAKDSPMVGGGFRLDNLAFYQRYAPPDLHHGILGAHSIYFQVLGEHGFPGLLLFLGLGVAVWRTGNRIIARSRDNAELRWADTLARMIQVSLIGFGVSATFGAMAHLDLVYYLVGIMVLADLATREPATSSIARSPDATPP